jgi:ketosteroid isomerase-like protein
MAVIENAPVHSAWDSRDPSAAGAPLLINTLLALAAAPCAHAQEVAADSSVVQANLKQMEDAWVKALINKDYAAVGNVVADDFAGFNPDGKHLTKSQLLDEVKNDPNSLTSSTNDNMDVNVYGPNRATVSGTTTEEGKDKDGKQFTHSYVWVDTWMERNGKWECIAEGVVQLPKEK